MPLQKATSGDLVMTQYNMTAVEKIGLLKIDFLGDPARGGPREGDVVRTSAGRCGRACWGTPLGGGRCWPPPRVHRWRAFGLETELDGWADPELHFHFLPEVRDGYAWVFPCAGNVRVEAYLRCVPRSWGKEGGST